MLPLLMNNRRWLLIAKIHQFITLVVALVCKFYLLLSASVGNGHAACIIVV